MRLPARVIVELLPLGLDEVLDERLALQVLRSVPGFSRLTGQMLRDCGVAEDGNLADAGLSSLTLQPGAMAAEVRPAR